MLVCPFLPAIQRIVFIHFFRFSSPPFLCFLNKIIAIILVWSKWIRFIIVYLINLINILLLIIIFIIFRLRSGRWSVWLVTNSNFRFNSKGVPSNYFLCIFLNRRLCLALIYLICLAILTWTTNPTVVTLWTVYLAMMTLVTLSNTLVTLFCVLLLNCSYFVWCKYRLTPVLVLGYLFWFIL